MSEDEDRSSQVQPPWYRWVAGDPWLDPEPFARVEALLRTRYGSGSSARLVTRHELEGSLHCVAVAYLSPEAEALALELGAVAVGRPAWLEPEDG